MEGTQNFRNENSIAFYSETCITCLASADSQTPSTPHPRTHPLLQPYICTIHSFLGVQQGEYFPVPLFNLNFESLRSIIVIIFLSYYYTAGIWSRNDVLFTPSWRHVLLTSSWRIGVNVTSLRRQLLAGFWDTHGMLSRTVLSWPALFL